MGKRKRRKRVKYHEITVRCLVSNTNNSESEIGKSKRIIQDLLGIVSMVTAVIAIVISYLTLEEMQKERKQASTPNIIIESSNKYIDLQSENIVLLLNVYNIGAGVAKDIKIIQNNENVDEWIAVDTQEITDGICNFYKQFFQEEILFLLPNAGNSYEYVLPEGYGRMLGELANGYEYDIEIPNLDICIMYSDNIGSSYEDNFEVSFRIYPYMPLKEGMHVVEIKITKNE